jgi:hypothetical protein
MESPTPNPTVCSNSLRYTFRPVVGLAALLLVAGVSWPASATTIKAGARIAVSPTTFVVPIDIADAVNAIGWQFDLTYDASDVLVNTGYDPFSSDPYCSLITGAVTEGDLFADSDPTAVSAASRRQFTLRSPSRHPLLWTHRRRR